jgi:hypothetical protein
MGEREKEDTMNKRALSVFIVLVMATLACTCNLLPDGGDGQEPPPSPTPANIYLQDDFSSADSGWEIGDYDFGSVGYKEGVYFVTATIIEVPMWGVANRSFDNVVIEVDATQVSAGPANNNVYGVVCREQGDSFGNGYYLRISGDGFYQIVKAEGEGGQFQALVDGMDTDAIHQGNATNHIMAVCNGSSLELFVNGKRLAGVEDNTYSSGDVALTATSYENTMTEVHFDNVIVREP